MLAQAIEAVCGASVETSPRVGITGALCTEVDSSASEADGYGGEMYNLVEEFWTLINFGVSARFLREAMRLYPDAFSGLACDGADEFPCLSGWCHLIRCVHATQNAPRYLDEYLPVLAYHRVCEAYNVDSELPFSAPLAGAVCKN